MKRRVHNKSFTFFGGNYSRWCSSELWRIFFLMGSHYFTKIQDDLDVSVVKSNNWEDRERTRLSLPFFSHFLFFDFFCHFSSLMWKTIPSELWDAVFRNATKPTKPSFNISEKWLITKLQVCEKLPFYKQIYIYRYRYSAADLLCGDCCRIRILVKAEYKNFHSKTHFSQKNSKIILLESYFFKQTVVIVAFFLKILIMELSFFLFSIIRFSKASVVNYYFFFNTQRYNRDNKDILRFEDSFWLQFFSRVRDNKNILRF